MRRNSAQRAFRGEYVFPGRGVPKPRPTLKSLLIQIRRIIPINKTVAYLAVSVIIVSGVIRLTQPTLRLGISDARAHFHLESTTGFDPAIRHIQLKRVDSGFVILDMVTESGTPKLADLEFAVGENYEYDIRPEDGSYRVTQPEEDAPAPGEPPDSRGPVYFLRDHVPYELTVWGQGPLPASATFTLGQ